MTSKAIKPKIRIGQSAAAQTRRRLLWGGVAALVTVGGYAAYRYAAPEQEVPVQVAKVRQGEFVISVRTRGEVKSVRSTILTAPQIPEVRIVRLAETGKPIRKGDVVVEFDGAQQEQTYLERNTSVRTVDSEITQTRASHQMVDESDGMNLMTAQYNVERAKLEASKAEVVSQIEGEKSRIDVGISQGELGQVGTTIKSHGVSQNADLDRLQQKKDKAVRDVNRAKDYLSKMSIFAPNDGVVNLLPNYRAQGSFGSSAPPFKEGDRAWTGAAIAEIPDLSEMRVDLKLEEVDRGKLQLGQQVRVKVDAVPDKEFTAVLDWISPIAQLNFRGPMSSEKQFPARATLRNLDARLRPGMSCTAELIIESTPKSLLIPVRSRFTLNGKPAAYVQRGSEFVLRPIQIGKGNEQDVVVTGGLRVGETVALENPIEAAKRARKL